MKILITTDGSKFSQAAIDDCRNIATAPENTSFKIISAVEFPTMLPSDPFIGASADYYDQFEQKEHSLAEEFTQRAETQLRALFARVSLGISTEVIDGSPQRVIVEEAEKWNADLIVVGSHGYGFWSRTLLGSVSSLIVHHAVCSVLVVRAAQDSDESN